MTDLQTALDAPASAPIPPELSALGPSQAEALDIALLSTATPWGSSRWDEAARCEVAYALRYEPQRYRLPLAPQEPAVKPASEPASEPRDGSSSSLSGSSSSGRSRGAKADAREVGSLIHACLAWQAEAELVGGVRSWRDVLARAGEQGDRWDPLSIAEARRLMPAYLSRWGDCWSASGFTVIAVELPLQITELDLELPWTTRADLVVREQATDLIWFVDHKTRGQSPSREDPEGAIRREARVRAQFLGTSLALREHYNLDYNPGVIVDVIVKTKEIALFRVPVVLGSHQLSMWRAAQAEHARKRSAGEQPRPNLRECVGVYGPCWAYEQCHGNE